MERLTNLGHSVCENETILYCWCLLQLAHISLYFIVLCLINQPVPFHSVLIPLLFEMYVLNCFFMCRPLGWSECPNFFGVRGLRLCPSHWRGGLVYKGMDKGSFDDVTSFILRRHQINLCLSLLKIYVPSSSTSSTSSSPSASSQRKSAYQHTSSWNRLVWYAKHLTERNDFFFCFLLFF